jgi:monothiol glutaredoxin
MSENKKISLPIAGSASVEQSEAPKTRQEGGDVLSEIAKINAENTVVLYMKGTPQQPMCGFSAAASAALSGYGRPYMAVNVLADPEIRQGIKEYGNWPTIPQLYVNDELLGGSDIIRQMQASGDLAKVLDEAYGADSESAQ